MLGQQGGDDLRVGGALEHVAALARRPARSSSVLTRLPLWRQGDERAVAGAGERLRVALLAGAGGGVAHVADGQLPGQGLEGRLLEHLGDQAHVLVDDQPARRR